MFEYIELGILEGCLSLARYNNLFQLKAIYYRFCCIGDLKILDGTTKQLGFYTAPILR